MTAEKNPAKLAGVAAMIGWLVYQPRLKEATDKKDAELTDKLIEEYGQMILDTLSRAKE